VAPSRGSLCLQKVEDLLCPDRVDPRERLQLVIAYGPLRSIVALNSTFSPSYILMRTLGSQGG